ncbi:CGNR zinc finger domain-containing protein [Actinomadura roseirufa]|uniref:CGNR zinc finger domain-containing protein n=1 Tax=Actinomadura roseirufa TaxID=2094049 RepID=UPI001A9558D4|nr:CGNR zinc finger domain-containing protein [Actinomadura roseirufa]
MTGQAALIAELVNLATPHRQGGAVVGRLAHEELVGAFATKLDANARTALHADPSAGPRLAELATELRRALLAADPSITARHVNAMIRKYGAQPYLPEDANGPFHLSFHGTAGSAVDTLAGGLATTLALIMDGYGPDRFGECRAHHCDAVYIDLTRNNSRRYCSMACTSRAKTAAYRTRRHTI